MIGLLGYNFFGDGDALNPSPTNINGLESTRMENGIFDHYTLTKDTQDDSQTPATQWLADMIINAGFNGTLSGGTLQDVAGKITGYKVKRRKLGDFDWITLAEEQVIDAGQLTFTLTDHLAASLTEYEYAFVPMIGDTEGGYIVKSIMSKFNGVFLADNDNSFKFDAEVQYGNTQTVQRVGVYEPFGKRHPVIVSNGNLSYETGSVSGLVLNENYQSGELLDRKAILAQRQLLLDFLSNRRPKILKDWNGQCWLMMVTQNPSVEYMQGTGMGLANVSVGWTEVGDCNDKQDLYSNGLIPTAD